MTGRELLAQGRSEEPGYGLYSYLVFGLRPIAGSPGYARFTKALEAYLELEETASVRNYAAQNAINILYLPVRTLGRTQNPAVLLDAYDYARAQRLLALTTSASADGPFLISAEQPLTRLSSLPARNIFQDLSTVPPDLVRLWVKYFIERAGQEQFWKSTSRDQFLLSLRTYIGAGGNEIASLGNAFGSLVWRFGPVNAPSASQPMVQSK
jgi:hypothetical protein